MGCDLDFDWANKTGFLSINKTGGRPTEGAREVRALVILLPAALLLVLVVFVGVIVVVAPTEAAAAPMVLLLVAVFVVFGERDLVAGAACRMGLGLERARRRGGEGERVLAGVRVEEGAVVGRETGSACKLGEGGLGVRA